MYEELIKALREWPRCHVEYEGSVDQLHDKAADAIEELSKRVPSVPHGRLIDADALKKILATAIPQYSLAGCATYADSDIMRWIDDAPTIIPTSEEGKT